MRRLGLGVALLLPLLTAFGLFTGPPWEQPHLTDFSSPIEWHGLTIRTDKRDTGDWDLRVVQGDREFFRDRITGLFQVGIGRISLLGSGTEQLLVSVATLGSAGFTTCRIFAADPSPRLIHSVDPDAWLRELEIADLDGDGIMEIAHPSCGRRVDDFLCNACEPRPLAIFRYDPSEGRYRPANWEFPEYLERRIRWDLEQLKQRKKDQQPYEGDPGGLIYGARVQVAFDWLYAGHDAEAWAFLAREEGVAEIPRQEKEELLKVLERDLFYQEVRKRWAAAKEAAGD